MNDYDLGLRPRTWRPRKASPNGKGEGDEDSPRKGGGGEKIRSETEENEDLEDMEDERPEDMEDVDEREAVEPGFKPSHKNYNSKRMTKLGMVISKDGVSGVVGVRGFDGELYSFTPQTQEDGVYKALVTVLFQVAQGYQIEAKIPYHQESGTRGSWIRQLTPELLDAIPT